MKRSTLLLLLAAIVGGILIYFLEIKPGKPRDEGTDKPSAAKTSKDAVSFKREDIVGITLTRGSETVGLETQGDQWVIKQPSESKADEAALNSLVGDIVSARIEREFPNPSAEALKEYGLAPPAVKLEVKLKDGKTHQIEIGGKDPLGSSAYARFDGTANVAVIGSALLTSADKPLKDWRDRALLGASEYDLTSLKVTNENGSFELGKKDSDWVITSPISTEAEASEVSGLIAELTSAKAADIVSDSAGDLAKYGLDKIKISVTAKTAGGDKGIQIGSKVEEQYYAKTTGGIQNGQIAKVDSSLYDKLNVKLSTLRSKQIIKVKREDLSRYELKNEHGKLVAEAKDDKWLVVEPADKKGKEAQGFKLFTPFESKASEIVEKPTAAITSKFAKPAAELRLTEKSGKTIIVKLSQPDGDNIYIRVEGRPEIFKLGKMMLESFNFKIEDAIQP